MTTGYFDFCRFPLDRYPYITLAHGGGGRLTQQLIDEIFKPAFQSSFLLQEKDGAILPMESHRLAMTTDSFVINPLFFRGGDIGQLAVTGVCNDLAMVGAEPRYLTVGFVLEEGFSIEKLIQITQSIARKASEVGAQVVTGDTKVVERGKGDGIYIAMSALGVVESETHIGPQHIETGDLILVSGPIGRHGVAIMSERLSLGFETSLKSDCDHLWPRVQALLREKVRIHALRDLTRGGLATGLIELAQTRQLEFQIHDQLIPLDEAVRGACELLGLDPLYSANEGTMALIVDPRDGQRCCEILQSFDPQACQVGEVLSQAEGRVRLQTAFETHYMLEKQSGEQLPRIC